MEPPEDEPTGKERAGHVSVIYVHGMGSQRRFEETSRLIDAIDRYLMGVLRRTGDAKGRLRGIRVRHEPSTADPSGRVTYVTSKLVPTVGQADGTAPTVRFYEVYWAPVMVGSHSALRILKWMFRQVLRPVQTLRSPWRERQRLRRSSLVELLEDPFAWPAGVERGDFDALVAAYDEFENWDAIRAHPFGTFDEFIQFLRARFNERKELEPRIRLAYAWRRRYRATELQHAFVLATIALALLMSAAGMVWTVLLGLQYAADLPFLKEPAHPITAFVGSWLKPGWAQAVSVVTSLATFVGITGFLSNYMGDVEAWAAYEETDERHERRAKIIERGTRMIEHVLQNPDCKRVVFVSHSLGTTIAHDSLLAVVRGNLAVNAQNPMDGPVLIGKISHFITMASPIDKVEYFFESYRTDYHRYRRVTEELRGDIGEAPFSANRRPYVHWVNYWDEGDPISGPLHSPVSGTRLKHRVDNVQVANLPFPAPGASHSAYFEHRDVIGGIFEMAYLDAYDYQRLPLRPRKGYDYDSMTLGPGKSLWSTRLFLKTAIGLPWLVVGFIVTLFLEMPVVAFLFGWASSIGLIFLVLGYFVNRARGHRVPL